MNKEELFDECLKEAINIGRKYMKYVPESDTEPTKQEWDLSLVLFKYKLDKQDE